MKDLKLIQEEIRAEAKRDKMKEIFRFIESASAEECAMIIGEIKCCSDNILVFDENTQELHVLDFVTAKDEWVYLNIKKYKEEE